MPSCKTDILEKTNALLVPEIKDVIQVVGNKFKAVFGNGKENMGDESERPAP